MLKQRASDAPGDREPLLLFAHEGLRRPLLRGGTGRVLPRDLRRTALPGAADLLRPPPNAARPPGVMFGCSTTIMPTAGSDRTRCNFRRFPFRPDPISMTTSATGRPRPVAPATTRATKLTDENRRGLTALFWSNVNPYGTFRLDNPHVM